MAFSALAMNNSCQSDDDLNDLTDNLKILSDSWTLTSIQGGATNINYNFEQGDIVWNFNGEANILSVVNNYNGDVAYNGLQTGDYSFSIIQFDAILLIEIDNESFGTYYIEDNTLIINLNGSTSGNSDGFILDFVKP